ncbi:hypothetical protein [Lacrimispora xylanisolvens]|uniref:hypothetical protein n=1 Tax=Lacrimispora xylanisolvens TaxID=384636 RepID=UPI00240277D2
MFRRLLFFNIYILNYGREYYEKTIRKEITEKAKSNIRTTKRNKEEQYLKEYFYSLDYSDLQSILFTQNWTTVDEEEISKFLKTHDNLSLIPEDVLRKFIQGIGAKSDWERLFKSKVGVSSIKEDIDYIRRQRNKVAHSKLFTYEDYKESLKTLNKLEKTINEAIKYTQDKDFLDKNSELFKVNMQKIIKSIRGLSEQVVDLSVPLKQMQMRITEIMKPVNEAMSRLHETLPPFLESIKNSSQFVGDYEFEEADSDDNNLSDVNETEED